MSRIEIIKSWDGQQLVSELRNPIRAKEPATESYILLVAEALARILERQDQ